MPGIKFHTTSSYQKENFPFPSHDIDPKIKESDPEWSRKNLEAMYSRYVTDNTAIPYSKIDDMQLNRDYAEGTQSVLPLKKILLDEAENSNELTGYMNLIWEPITVMPKFLHIIQGLFEEQEHKCVATAVDPKSTEEKARQKMIKWFQGRYKPLINAVDQLTGEMREPEWIPETIDELNLYEAAGGFKLARETEIEEALDYTFYISDWKEIKRKKLHDLASIGCAAVRDYTDRYTQKVKAHYVDPLKLIIQYSRYQDHRNSEFGGELIFETISNVRKVTDLSEEDLKKIAQFYNGRYGNSNISSWSNDYLYFEDGSCAYDNFHVLVLDGEWFSINSQYRTKRKNERGNELEYDEKWGKTHDTDKRKTTIKQYKAVYRGKLIIGTDYVYDYGLQYDVPRPGKKEVELSFKFTKIPGRSIVDLSRQHIDQIVMTGFKLQNALAMAAPSGIAVEYSSLMNMKLGGDDMEPLDILDIRRDTGDLIWKATTHKGHFNTAGGIRPIQELQGGIGNQLNELVALFELHLNFIRDLTGINQITDATTPDPNQSVRGSELAIAATNNALKPIYSGYIRLKELVARSAALRIQLSVANNNGMYEGYVPILGSTGVQLLSVGTEVLDVDYHIKIEAKPTRERKQIILQAAMEAMKRDKDGYSDLEYKDFLMIERMLENGNEKLAEMMLTYLSNRNKQLKLEIQSRMQRENEQNAQQTAIVKSQEAMKMRQMDAQIEKDKEQQKHDLDKDLEYNKHLWKMEEMRLQNSLTENKTQQKSA